MVFYIFILLWLALNLFTAISTNLIGDEAYYWMYSQFLDWGYFDHPPGIAVLVKLGSWLPKSELSVRIFSILFCCASFILMYKKIKPKNSYIFSATLFGFLIFNILGFVALPDGLFFFLSIIYLHVFNRAVQSNATSDYALVGLFSALLLYSKYHGLLVIGFSLLATPKILLGYPIYLSAIIGIALFLPHLIWQYLNDFPSFTYHLISRGGTNYRLHHTVEYLFGNIPYHGGLVLLVLFIATFYFKSQTTWHRILKWNIYGTLILFLALTFNGQFIQSNWTLPAIFPIIYLGYKKMEQSKYYGPFKVLVLVFVPIMLLLRIHLVHPLFKNENDRVWDFHYGATYANLVNEYSNNEIIVANRYQDASLLNFYLGKDYFIPSINSKSRSNQYSLWQFEKELCGKDVNFVSKKEGGKKVTAHFKSDYIKRVPGAIFPNCLELNIIDTRDTKDSLHISFKILGKRVSTEDIFSQYSLLVQVAQENDSISSSRYNLESLQIDNNLFKISLAKESGSMELSSNIFRHCTSSPRYDF